MTYELDAATWSTPVSPGVRSVELTAEWNTPAGTANGGYLLAILVRAALEESDKPDPLSVAVTYLKPTTPGPAVVTVTPVREGRRVSTFTVVLSQGGTPITHGVVSLHDADLAGAKQHLDEVPPALPAPPIWVLTLRLLLAVVAKKPLQVKPLPDGAGVQSRVDSESW